ncbi:MAG TPA: type II secretion system protein [Gemmatimonadales bacterium]
MIPSRAPRRGVTPVELVLLVAALGSLLGVVVPIIGAWRQRPVIEALRANLRNLAAAQESHFYDFRGYAGDLEALRRTGFAPANGVRLVIREATRAGWSAGASHPGTRVQCFLFVREATAPSSAPMAGSVHCR